MKRRITPRSKLGKPRHAASDHAINDDVQLGHEDFGGTSFSLLSQDEIVKLAKATIAHAWGMAKRK